MTGLSKTQKFGVGVALVVVGIALNPWLVAHLATSDASIQSIEMFASILLLSTASVLAGLQLLVGWVDRLAWSRPVGAMRAATLVAACAFLIAGVYWRIATFNAGHTHTALVDTGHDVVTPEQEQWAAGFYQRSLAAALRNGWFDVDRALERGFQVDRVNYTHYPNLHNMFDDVILDPERPEWLIYHDSPDGKTLMGFMFFTRRLEEVGPTPGGPIAQWHYHPYDRPRCAVEGLWTVGRPDENGRCAEGIPVMRTPEMLHVWFVDHPLGRFTEMNIVPSRWETDGLNFARLHPVAVHFAVALLVMAVLLDLAALITRKREYHDVARINLVLAAVAAVAAVTAGMTAELALKPTHAAHETLDVHRLFGYATLAGVLALAAWRYALRGHFPRRGATFYVALSLAALGSVGVAGYYGGEMVYSHGAGVDAIDRFARDRYLTLVRQIYRHPGADTLADVLELPRSVVHEPIRHAH